MSFCDYLRHLRAILRLMAHALLFIYISSTSVKMNLLLQKLDITVCTLHLLRDLTPIFSLHLYTTIATRE